MVAVGDGVAVEGHASQDRWRVVVRLAIAVVGAQERIGTVAEG